MTLLHQSFVDRQRVFRTRPDTFPGRSLIS